MRLMFERSETWGMTRSVAAGMAPLTPMFDQPPDAPICQAQHRRIFRMLKRITLMSFAVLVAACASFAAEEPKAKNEAATKPETKTAAPDKTGRLTIVE